MLDSCEQDDEDGLTDIANTDDLIDNDFVLDAGNAAMVADAEKELSSYSSGSVHSGRSDEEMEEEEMDSHLDHLHATVSTDSMNYSASSNYHSHHSLAAQKHSKGGHPRPLGRDPQHSMPLESQLHGTELLFLE